MNQLLKISFLGLVFLIAGAFSIVEAPVEEFAGEKVKWYTWEEAIEANKKEPRKILVDIYTGWCSWCKVMDKKTFGKADIAKIMNNDFYPVKLNAEQREDILFNDHTFKFVKSGRRGVHTLAYSLLDGQMSYPAIVFLDEKVSRITTTKGFQEAKDFKKILAFISGDHYKNTAFKQFEKDYQE